MRIVENFVFRVVKAHFYHFGIIGRSQTEARFEFFHRRRKHENENSLIRKGFFDIYRSLVIDVADNIPACIKLFLQEVERCSVKVSVDFSPFGEKPGVSFCEKLVFCEKKVVGAINFMSARLSCRA